jgi:hypothetical protein
VIAHFNRRSSPWPSLGHLDRDWLGILGAHHPHLRQIDPFFGSWQVKVNRLVFVENERLVRKVFHLLSWITIDGNGNAGGWHPTGVRKGKMFISIHLDFEPGEPFRQPPRPIPFGPSYGCGCGFAPFSPTVQRLAELTEPDAYRTAHERSEDRQHDLQPNGHPASITQTEVSEPAAQAVEVDIPMTRHRTSGTPVVTDRTPAPQRAQRTPVIGAHEADVPTDLHPTLTDLRQRLTRSLALQPASAMISTFHTPQPRHTTRQQSGTSERGAGIQSTTVLLLACEGEIRFDYALFADTGWEPRQVYENLARLRAHAENAGIPVRIVSAGNIRTDALDPAHRFVSMPLHVLNVDGSRGLARRQCTSDPGATRNRPRLHRATAVQDSLSGDRP